MMHRKIRILITGIFCLVGSAVVSQEILTSLPFDIQNNRNIVSVVLQDKDTLTFIFDSGAGTTAIDSSKATKLFSGMEQRTISNQYLEYYIPDVELSIGSFPLGKTELHVSGDWPDFNLLKTSIDGAIGSKILNEYVTEINYDEMRITLWDQMPDHTLRVLKMVDHPLFAVLPCSIVLPSGKEVEGDFIVDTGAPSSLVLFKPFADRTGILDQTDISQKGIVSNAGRDFNVMHSVVPEICFQDHVFSEVPIVISQSTTGFLGTSRFAGLIGNEVLKRFNIIWDYRNNQLALEPSILFDTPIE